MPCCPLAGSTNPCVRVRVAAASLSLQRLSRRQFAPPPSCWYTHLLWTCGGLFIRRSSAIDHCSVCCGLIAVWRSFGNTFCSFLCQGFSLGANDCISFVYHHLLCVLDFITAVREVIMAVTNA